MKETTIRFAQQQDIQDLIKLCELHAHYEQADYKIEGKVQKMNTHLFKAVPSLYCLVAIVNQKIVGYTTYMKQFSTWDTDFYIYMDCLFLTEDARGLGIGEKLIDRIKEEGRKLGCDLIQWQTPDFNKRAMKFYSRIGATGKSKERYFLEIK